MTDFHCKHCKSGRFIGRGEGTGKIRIQCRGCGQWQWVELTSEQRAEPASLAEARLR